MQKKIPTPKVFLKILIGKTILDHKQNQYQHFIKNNRKRHLQQYMLHLLVRLLQIRRMDLEQHINLFSTISKFYFIKIYPNFRQKNLNNGLNKPTDSLRASFWAGMTHDKKTFNIHIGKFI